MSRDILMLTIQFINLKIIIMKFNNKLSIPLSDNDKNYIEKKANENRQTMSGFVRSKLFERIDLRSEDQLPY